jgi:hexosaminidase
MFFKKIIKNIPNIVRFLKSNQLSFDFSKIILVKIMKLLIAMLVITNLSLGQQMDNALSLIPQPKQFELLSGEFQLSENTLIKNESGNLSEYFISTVKLLTGLEINTKEKSVSENKIILRVNNNLDLHKESYSLTVTEKEIVITGTSEEGLFRGIQTFFQLIPPIAKEKKNNRLIKIQCCKIKDQPEFVWRGLNLDCGRHFMSKDFIKRYIDILAYYKFNVLHWHLTEDQGWRVEIKKYPKLTEVGAWRKEADGTIYGGSYSQEDIREIIAYAESRFITVVPEIEMPGHSLASLTSYPENSCTGGPFEVGNIWGVMKDVYCAGNDSTFTFLQNILDEVISLFPGKYIHIGGDEVPKDRWSDCSRCQQRIITEGLRDEEELQSYFIKKISSYLNSKGKTVIGWDEILQGGLAPGTIVQSWQGFEGAIESAKQDHYTICSPAGFTYLNSSSEDLDLRIAYSFDPVPKELSGDEKKYVLGSEANLWTEHAPQETVDSKLFPRILALTEIFWTYPKNKNYDEFYSRIQKSYKDLAALGINFGSEGKAILFTTNYNESDKSFVLNLESGQNNIELRYTTDKSMPDHKSELNIKPLTISESKTVTISAFLNSQQVGNTKTLSFNFHKALNAYITVKNMYHERYRANGEKSLIDGIRGTDNFKDGNWQGFEGVDFEATIDLGTEQTINKVIPRFYLNSNSWIFLPEEVDISISTDGKNYSESKTILNDIPQKNSEIILKDFTANFLNTKARLIKVVGKNIKVCPDWHPGAGGKAWLFIDEIVVE